MANRAVGCNIAADPSGQPIMTNAFPSLLIDIPPGVIDLGRGHPSARLHPAGVLAAATDSVLKAGTPLPLQYGAVPGFGPLLEGLAAFLSVEEPYGGLVRPESLFLTGGVAICGSGDHPLGGGGRYRRRGRTDLLPDRKHLSRPRVTGCGRSDRRRWT